MATPNLSQDFYRFIWDGRMLAQGLNPYLNTVISFISAGHYPVNEAQQLFEGMGNLNASHYTNYPPINQLCFTIGAFISNNNILGSVITMRVLIILSDFGTFYFGSKLLNYLKLPVKRIFWFLLNPFIIIELTGNLHFESVMIFFIIWGLYLLTQNRWKLAAVAIALSVSTKLIPLLFLPLFFKYFVKKTNPLQGIKKLVAFYAIIFIIIAVVFAPFFSTQFIDNYSKTVGLWFQNFEFNASIYYIIREIGYWFRGYNEIGIIGKILPIITFLWVIFLTFFKKNNTIKSLIVNMLFAYTIYLFLSTTVHPWYIATLLMLSIFTNYKFSLVWSFMLIISYLAYTNSNNTENLWVIFIEYFVVYGVFFYEVFSKQKKKLSYTTKPNKT